MRLEEISRRRLLSSLVIALVFFCGACGRRMNSLTTDDPPKQNGIYAVFGRAATPGDARGNRLAATVLSYDRKYVDADSSGAVEYVAIDTSSFVPLILECSPDAKKDEAGKTVLSVTLEQAYVKTLEDFTRAHLNGEIATILDGEIITIHKLRSVIVDGKFQLSRCEDNACEILRSKLTK